MKYEIEKIVESYENIIAILHETKTFEQLQDLLDHDDAGYTEEDVKCAYQTFREDIAQERANEREE